ncbi:MAG: hypothetical protein J5993_06100 [Clostridia bacterium]|nr:hypothetical protein [Clostridia bacterium]
MVIIVLTQGLKKQSFEAPTEPKVGDSSSSWRTTKKDMHRISFFAFSSKLWFRRPNNSRLIYQGSRNDCSASVSGRGATDLKSRFRRKRNLWSRCDEERWSAKGWGFELLVPHQKQGKDSFLSTLFVYDLNIQRKSGVSMSDFQKSKARSCICHRAFSMPTRIIGRQNRPIDFSEIFSSLFLI